MHTPRPQPRVRARTILGIAGVLLLAACGNGHHTGDDDDSGPSLPDCPAGTALLTTAPLADGDFTGLVPLGNLNPPGHTFPTDHNYFYVRLDGGTPAAVPVVSPGVGWMTNVGASEHLSEVPPYTDYNFDFQPCAQVGFSFGHVTLNADLLTRIGPFDDANCQTYSTGGQDYRLCNKQLDLEITAGEALGTAGRVGQNALDLGAWDDRVTPLAFANPTRLYDRQLHTVCAIDYFETSVRDALRARFSNYDGSVPRTVPPVCGEIEQDEPGTAQGKWYVAGTTESFPEDPHLALVHDNVDPTIGAFSVGTSIPGLGPGVFTFAPTASGAVDRDFDQVTDDGTVHCYDVAGGRVLLELTDPVSLSIEYDGAAGTCGAGPFTLSASAIDFER